MNTLKTACQCSCGAQEFELRLKRDEQVGLLTCAVGHHSLLLDSRDYWADVLQDGRPRRSRCRCGSSLFRVSLEYERRENGDVRSILIRPACSGCQRPQSVVEVDIKYSPTSHLIRKPLDPIEKPWLQPKRHEITSLWRPADAEQFSSYLVRILGARILSGGNSRESIELQLGSVEFYPELKHDLFFTDSPHATLPNDHEPQRSSPFLRLTAPFHMLYSLTNDPVSLRNNHLLHYIKYSKQIARGGELQQQPATFLAFARQACEWLSQNYVSLRGKNTADNLEEYLRAKTHLPGRPTG